MLGLLTDAVLNSPDPADASSIDPDRKRYRGGKLDHTLLDAISDAIGDGTNYFKYTAPNGVALEKSSDDPCGCIAIIVRVPGLGAMQFEGTDSDDIDKAAALFHEHANA
ncbi:MAG: hypothetical protein IH987_05230 [Planctomycetes bacterium]|nr:hypothetical protein [Planctomycetota bacterium]